MFSRVSAELRIFLSCASFFTVLFSFSLSELLLHTLQLPVGHPDQPFSIRLLSFDNLLAAPIDCYCPVTTVATGVQDTSGDKNGSSGAENGVQQVRQLFYV